MTEVSIGNKTKLSYTKEIKLIDLTNFNTKLNLGSGKENLKGYINIDWISSPKTNLMLNLSTEKLPFIDSSISEIRAYDVLEHLWNWEDLIEECIRILKVGGRFELHVPYRLTDLNTYHKRFFDETTFDGFLVGSVDFDSPYATTLEGSPVFRRISRTYNRKPFYPFAWHLKKYLGIPCIGKKIGMTEKFEKVKHG